MWWFISLWCQEVYGLKRLCDTEQHKEGKHKQTGGEAQSRFHLPCWISHITHNAYFTFYKTKEMKENISFTEEDISPLIAEMTDIFRWRSSLTYLH